MPSRPTLTLSLRRSLRSMHWLSPSDQALVELAYKLAATLDADPPPSVLRMVSAKFLDVLGALGATPAARKALGLDLKAPAGWPSCARPA